MASAYKVEIQAGRELLALPDGVKAEAIRIISDLGDDPYPPDAIALERYKCVYRIKFHSG